MNKPLNLAGICFVCKQRHDNLGFAPTYRHPIKEVCWKCLPIAKAAYSMKKVVLDAYEQDAMQAGQDAVCAYLDKVGEYDMRELTEQSWIELFATYQDVYAVRMRSNFEVVKVHR